MKQQSNEALHLKPEQYPYPLIYQQENEINLFDLFSAVFSEWKLLSAMTLVGVLLTLLLLFILPKQYESSAQLAPPESSDISALNIRGYEQYSADKVFLTYYDHLRSPEHLKRYLKHGDWYTKLYPDGSEDAQEDELFSGLYQNFEANAIRSLSKDEDIELSVPKLVNIKLAGKDEESLTKLLNGYVSYTNRYLLEQIANKGKNSVSLEIEKIEKTLAIARSSAKLKRELLISKLEEQNLERIASLEDEKNLLLAKAKSDVESKIAVLEEAYAIAKQVGIKKLTTLSSFATANKSAKTIVSLSDNNSKINALMGTVYLKSELETLAKRKNYALFVPEISSLIKQIEDIKQDEQIIALKNRKSDDPYITEIAPLLTQIDQLKQLNFDFTPVKLYRLDQAAYVDGIAKSPKRTLIFAVGFVLSLLFSLFAVLIVIGIKNNALKKQEEL